MSNFHIFKVPESLRTRSPEAVYEPKVISIGPYHLDKSVSVGNLYCEVSRSVSNSVELEGRTAETETPIHIAARLGDLDTVKAILVRNPRIAGELNENGYSPLHLACWMDRLDIVREIMGVHSKLCLINDKFGRTPLHTATMKGRVDVMKELLNACSESLTRVTARCETPLHTAVLYNQVNALHFLLDWLKRTENTHLINSKDRGGNTILHLATSRKQLRTIEILLQHDPSINAVVEINAMNNGGFTVLDILDVLPPCGKMVMEIDKILQGAGALRARDIPKPAFPNGNQEVLINCGDCYQPSSYPDITKYVYSAVLLTATLFATITFRAALYPPGSHWEEGHTYKSDLINNHLHLEKQNLTLTRCFIFFNSMGFFTSVAMILFLMHDFPWKPWLFISVFSLVGSYMCSIIETSPREALALVFLGSPFVLLAVAPRRLILRRMGLKLLKMGMR